MKTFDVGNAKTVWPGGIVRRCRVPFRCDYDKGAPDGRCTHQIKKDEYYFDSTETKSRYAGGFGSQRFCMGCIGGVEMKS